MKPDFEPWLGHLRRDRRGLPVPYVNRWGPEDTARMEIRHDPHAQGRAVFLDDSAETEPDFTRQNMGRQRECMALGLCQVCARPVPWSRRNLVVAALSVEWVYLPEYRAEVPVVFEPWLDDRCAEIAVSWCPALIRRQRSEELTVIKIRSRRDVALVASRGWVEGHLAEETQADQAVIWLKLAVLNHRIARTEPAPRA